MSVANERIHSRYLMPVADCLRLSLDLNQALNLTLPLALPGSTGCQHVAEKTL